MKQVNTALKIVVGVVLALAVVGLLAFIIRYTNGGTTELRTFYIEANGTQILKNTDMYLFEGTPLHIEPKYLFGSVVELDGYHYRIVPRGSDKTSFNFTVDGRTYTFGGIEEVTSAFRIEADETGFTVENDFGNGNVMQQVLERLYPEREVESEPRDDMDKTVYFDLVVSDYNDGQSITIGLKFPINMAGVELDGDGYVLNGIVDGLPADVPKPRGE